MENYSYFHGASAQTRVIKNGPGYLHTLTINTLAASTITLYDNTAASGTIIAVIKASALEQTFIYDCQFAVGLTIITAGAPDITVSYT